MVCFEKKGEVLKCSKCGGEMVWYVDTLLCNICDWEVVWELYFDHNVRKGRERSL